MAVIVTDRRSNLLYVNAYALRLFEVPGDAGPFIGQSVLAVAFGEERDKVADLTGNVLRGRTWEGTFVSSGRDGSGRLHPGLRRPAAAPVRRHRRHRDLRPRGGPRLAGASGTGSACWSGSASGWPARSSWTPRCGTWPRCWSRSSPITASSTCSRATSWSAGCRPTPTGWQPPPGSWAEVGEQVRYPEGHFCQQAMARTRDRRRGRPDRRGLPGAQRGQHAGRARDQPGVGGRRCRCTPAVSCWA